MPSLTSQNGLYLIAQINTTDVNFINKAKQFE